jgi:hypothetical protein
LNVLKQPGNYTFGEADRLGRIAAQLESLHNPSKRVLDLADILRSMAELHDPLLGRTSKRDDDEDEDEIAKGLIQDEYEKGPEMMKFL